VWRDLAALMAAVVIAFNAVTDQTAINAGNRRRAPEYKAPSHDE